MLTLCLNETNNKLLVCVVKQANLFFLSISQQPTALNSTSFLYIVIKTIKTIHVTSNIQTNDCSQMIRVCYDLSYTNSFKQTNSLKQYMAQYMYTLLLLFKGHNYAFPGRYHCGAVHVYTVVAI